MTVDYYLHRHFLYTTIALLGCVRTYRLLWLEFSCLLWNHFYPPLLKPQ